MNVIENSVGVYIQQRRKALRMTQVDLSKELARLGYDRASTTIANWEAGEYPVPLELLAPLARALKEPSPVILYDLAGVLDQIPGGQIVQLLSDAPQEEVDRAERILRALLKNND